MGESPVEVASVEDMLRKEGYSEKAIREVLRWYNVSPKERRCRKKEEIE